ncbi:MAG: homoserine dehydrogenase [Candidatus Latescibacteria bacterium]|nr:homoserine dehydrogenase [Candidatus Latescibacterota bacterium]
MAIGIGLIGMGVVGGGVARILHDRENEFKNVRGLDLDIRKVAVRDLSKPRAIDLPSNLFTTDATNVVNDPEIQIVIEVSTMGNAAHDLILAALQNGKDVITANKALLAERGDGLFEAAANNNVGLGFEASVCGGIPIIQTLSQGLVANQIESLYGILNGTTNYILTRMTEAGADFDPMLKEAQDKGFAEADPTMDIDGTDAAQKLALLCRLAFRQRVSPGDILKEGISHITARDIDFARELGYTIKLLGIAKSSGDQIEARVHPALVPHGALLADIRNEFNAVEIVGSAVDAQVFYGKGAGELPTASAVVADLITLAERRQAGLGPGGAPLAPLPSADLKAVDDIRTGCYCRFTVHDKPGVLAQISAIFAEENISIETVIQHGRSETDAVPLIMISHEAPEAAMRQAIARIDSLTTVTEKSQIIRILHP